MSGNGSLLNMHEPPEFRDAVQAALRQSDNRPTGPAWCTTRQLAEKAVDDAIAGLNDPDAVALFAANRAQIVDKL